MSYFNPEILKDRVAFVTGGGSGICQGIAEALAAHGAKVALVGRTQAKLDRVAGLIRDAGGDALPVAADVRQPDAIAQAIAATVERWGGLDIVVNGAAGNFLAPAAQLSPNGFRTVVDIDLCGTFNVCRAAFEHLSKPGGIVLNISANLHYGGTPMQVHASAAKAGIDALTMNLAVEWGPLGIRVNVLAPGPIDETEGMSRLAPGHIKKKLTGAIPLKRFGSIAEMANIAVFLCSDASAYMTGAIVVADGGQWLPPAGFAELLGY